jgi:hypothetical protein
MTAVRRAFAVLLGAALCLAGPHAAAAQSQAEADEGVCSVRVAAVAPLDASATLQAVVIEPNVTGSAVLSGSVALFTSSNLRYDLPFANAPIGSSAPLVLVYRFPERVVVTGAYVASLDAPLPGPCAIMNPWWTSVVPDALARAALAGASSPNAAPPIPVTVAGAPDTPACREPTAPARTLKEAPPQLRFLGHGDPPEGSLTIRVIVGIDGHPLDVQIDRVEGTIDETSSATSIRSTALSAAMASTYAPATFRCRPILGIAYYRISYRSRGGLERSVGDW